MDARRRLELLHREIFREQESCFAILDGAQVGMLPRLLRQHGVEYQCLYSGKLEGGLDQVAPYLVRLHARGEFTEFLLAEGWGKSWFVLLYSPVDLQALRRHFRTFLRVRGPDGKVLYFRYYDPRILRVYLPTCTPLETKTVFGPVTEFLVEGEDGGELLRFAAASGEADPTRFPLNG